VKWRRYVVVDDNNRAFAEARILLGTSPYSREQIWKRVGERAMANSTNALARTLVKPREAASLLHVSPQTVYQWVESGKIEAIKVSRSLRILTSSLAGLLDPREHPSP
jgi:excisionase family DNA binding protein